MPEYLNKQVSKPISRLACSGAIGAGDIAAALSIEAAVISILTNDLRSGCGETIPAGRRGAGGFAEERALRFLDERQMFYAWVDAMTAAGLAVGPVLDAVIEGKPLTTIDLSRKKRKGWTRRLVQKGLKLYRDLAAAQAGALPRLTA